MVYNAYETKRIKFINTTRFWNRTEIVKIWWEILVKMVIGQHCSCFWQYDHIYEGHTFRQWAGWRSAGSQPLSYRGCLGVCARTQNRRGHPGERKRWGNYLLVQILIEVLQQSILVSCCIILGYTASYASLDEVGKNCFKRKCSNVSHGRDGYAGVFLSKQGLLHGARASNWIKSGMNRYRWKKRSLCGLTWNSITA